MPVKRRTSKHKPHLTPELRPKVKRWLALDELYHEASDDYDHPFRQDGRWEERIDLGSEIRMALGIRPWEDDRAIIEAALRKAERE